MVNIYMIYRIICMLIILWLNQIIFQEKNKKHAKIVGIKVIGLSFNIVSSISRRHSFVHIQNSKLSSICPHHPCQLFLSLLKYAYMWVHAWTSLFHKDINGYKENLNTLINDCLLLFHLTVFKELWQEAFKLWFLRDFNSL